MSREKNNYLKEGQTEEQYWYSYHDYQRKKINEEIIGKKNIQYNDRGFAEKIDYMSGKTKEIWDRVFNEYKKFEMSPEETVNHLKSSSKLYPMDVEAFMKGEKEMTLSQHIHLLDCAGFSVWGNFLQRPFKSEIQHSNSERGTRLILSRLVEPRFDINIRLDDWWDMEFDTHFKQSTVEIGTFIRMVFVLIDWYFDKDKDSKVKKRKNPYTRKRLHDFIKLKCNIGELNIGSYSREIRKMQPKRRVKKPYENGEEDTPEEV